MPANHPANGYLPQKVLGVKNIAFFDRETGIKKPMDSVIQMDTFYYVLADETIDFPKGCLCFKRCTKRIDDKVWFVYEVKIYEAKLKIAKLLLESGYRLNDKEIQIYPIWPVTIQTPHLWLHQKGELTLFLKGLADIKSFPDISRDTNKYKISEESHIIYCRPQERNQLIAAGRMSVLKYMYLWDDDLKIEGNSPVCVVQTDDKCEVQSGEHNELPSKRRMTISITVNGIQVDGFVEIRRNKVVVRKQVIKSDGRNDIEELNYGDCVQVYSGLDKIWECTFACKPAEKHIGDEALYQELIRCGGRTVDAPHALGALAGKLKDYPKTLQWLRRCIRDGKIDKRALLVLKSKLL